MTESKRFSVNTALRDANIFEDDDSWDNKSNEPEKTGTTSTWRIEQAKIDFQDEDSNFSFHIKKEDIAMLTPTKFENNDSNSRDSNSQKQRASLKSIKRTLKPRGSPYSKGDSLHEKMENAKIENKEASSRVTAESKYEEDAVILNRRQKQIDYGKNTIGYDKYIQKVPRHERKPEDPRTPTKHRKYSRRAWDSLIKQWRLKLHQYD